ncbi:hypothetical protein ACFY3G_18280 [Streptomyces phaeochromogenes]|uniref:hypothetical protein n=1 Tax=Streptomyces phaeochromogenes TaxID=1923 RepID=UPI00367CDEB7
MVDVIFVPPEWNFGNSRLAETSLIYESLWVKSQQLFFGNCTSPPLWPWIIEFCPLCRARLNAIVITPPKAHNERVMTEEQLNKQFADFFGKLTNHLDARLDAATAELKQDIDQVRTTVDGIAKRSETDEQERIALTGEVQRHRRWIEQIADSTGTQLATD